PPRNGTLDELVALRNYKGFNKFRQLRLRHEASSASPDIVPQTKTWTFVHAVSPYTTGTRVARGFQTALARLPLRPPTATRSLHPRSRARPRPRAPVYVH